jgi:hypothetical protein
LRKSGLSRNRRLLAYPRDKIKKEPPQHIIVKAINEQNKERILKATREK